MPDQGWPSRRAALRSALGLAAGAAAAAGCRPFGRHQASPPPADETIKRRVLASKQALLGRYRATIERYPQLQAALAPFVADHSAHVAALDTTAASPTGTAHPPGSATPSAAASAGQHGEVAVPDTALAALTALAAAERAAAAARVTDAAGASPRLARVLASIGGCEASHAALLPATSTETAGGHR